MIWTILKTLIPGAWKWLAAGAGLVGVYLKIRSGDKAKAENKVIKEDLKAHERINEADLGVGASDAERVDRLRGFAAKHGSAQNRHEGP